MRILCVSRCKIKAGYLHEQRYSFLQGEKKGAHWVCSDKKTWIFTKKTIEQNFVQINIAQLLLTGQTSLHLAYTVC